MTTLQMSPSYAADGFSGGLRADVELSGNSAPTHSPGDCQGPHLAHVGLGEFVHALAFTGPAQTQHHVPAVTGVVSKVEVPWVAAGRIVAMVADVGGPSGEWISSRQRPCDAVTPHWGGSSGNSAKLHHAVPVVNSLSNPRPARILSATAIHLRPELGGPDIKVSGSWGGGRTLRVIARVMKAAKALRHMPSSACFNRTTDVQSRGCHSWEYNTW